MRGAAGASTAAGWRAAVEAGLKGRTFDDALVSQSADGFAIQPLDAPDRQPAISRRARSPTIFQRVDHPDLETARRLAALDLEEGAAGLTLCFAGSCGARGFGRPAEGETIPALLSGLALDRAPLRLELPPFAGPDLALAVAAIPGVSLSSLDVGLDPLGDMARYGGAPAPWHRLAGELRTSVAALRAAGLTGPMLRADGRAVHEAGGTEAQELAAVLAGALAALRVLEARGTPLDEARSLLSFTLAADTDVPMTIAKCRAIRVLWAGIEAACGIDAYPIRLHVETAWRRLARHSPQTNIIRGTIACAAALLGGADSVTVLPHTGALGLPDAPARRLARNTPLILLEEAHLGRVADPCAGSGAIANLTEALRTSAWALFQGIEREGGLPEALALGSWQARIEQARLRRQALVASGALPIVGSTMFADPDETPAVPAPRQEEAGAWLRDGAPRFPALPSMRDEQAAEAHA